MHSSIVRVPDFSIQPIIQGADADHRTKTARLGILRHRIILSYEAEAEGETVEQVVRKILEHVQVP